MTGLFTYTSIFKLLPLATVIFFSKREEEHNHFTRGSKGLSNQYARTNYKCFSLTCRQWRRPGAKFGGDGKIFRGPRFLNDVLFGIKFPFSRLKFLMTFFSHRPGFSDFPFLLPYFPYLCYVK